MAFLTADKTYTANGVKVCQKILPANLRPNRKLNTVGNKPAYVTIHNTPDINEASGTNDAEQYARATFNGNMNDVSVHFYIDETGCWQILPLDEIGYHAGDYSNKNGGNWTSIGIEIIMDGSGKSWDIAAEDRGARLAAWLLYTYSLPIDRLTTHQHWNGKNCPVYILPHWEKFKANVKKYLDILKASSNKPKTLYRVQVGAYTVKENAEAMKNRLTRAGFEAFIKEEVLDNKGGDTNGN